MKANQKHNFSAFSLIEVILFIFIFTTDFSVIGQEKIKTNQKPNKLEFVQKSFSLESLKKLTSKKLLKQETLSDKNKKPREAVSTQTTGWNTLLYDDFEVFEDFESNWNRYYANEGPGRGYTWSTDEYRPNPTENLGDKSLWCADWQYLDLPDLEPENDNYPNEMAGMIERGPFDFSDADDAKLQFEFWLQCESNHDFFFYLVSIGQIDPDQENFGGGGYHGNSQGWMTGELDLKNVLDLGNICGESQVWIYFAFVSDENYTYKGAFVDNVLLEKHVPTSSCSITVQNPNGGEEWIEGSTHDILWQSNNTSGNVKISNSTDSGANWTTITNSTPDDGNYTWTLPQVDADQTNCRILVEDANNSDCWDISDNDFTIKNDDVTIVNFPDQNLEQVIREALNKDTGDITSADMETLTELNGSCRGIKVLNGLEYAVNLKKLKISNLFCGGQNYSSDESKNIYHLTNSDESGINQAVERKKAERFKHLIDKNLNTNIAKGNSVLKVPTQTNGEIKDISPLSILIKLEYLDLSGNQISDLNPLSNLLQLQYLDFFSNQIVNINPLANLILLQELDLSFNKIRNLTPIKDLINLLRLYLSSNEFSDISILSNLSNLSTLFLSYNENIASFSSLANLVNLNGLMLKRTGFQELSILSNLANLWYLDLGENEIIDISVLAILENLSHLKLDHNQIQDITALSNLIKMTDLAINNNQLNDDDLPNLYNLDLLDNEWIFIWSYDEYFLENRYLDLRGNLGFSEQAIRQLDAELPLIDYDHILWDPASCSITVDNPNGGESWNEGSTHDITWHSTGTSGNVRIRLSYDSGATWQELINSTPDDGNWAWTLPAVTSTQTNCRIRVEDTADGTCNDMSDNDFTIVNIPSAPICTFAPVSAASGSEFWLEIEVGSTDQPVNELSAVAFELFYTHTHIVDYIIYEVGSFITNASATILPDDVNGKISVSVYRTDGSGNSGNGTVVRLKFKMAENAGFGESVCFNMGAVQAQNKFGEQILLAPCENPCIEVSGLIVWPGDADNDGDVDIFDILSIVNVNNWEITGPARPNASTDWIGQPCPPWTPESATYCDCNGSGKVDIFDILVVVGPNYGKTHTLLSGLAYHDESASELLKNSLSDPPIFIEARDYDEINKEFWIDVIVGSSSQPVTDLKSIAFELTYTNTLNIDYDSYELGSFLSGGQATVMPDDESGKVSAAVYRLSGTGETGTGVILSIKFKADMGHTIDFNFPGVQAETSNGSQISLSPVANTLVTKLATFDHKTTTDFALIQNYPNPFNPETTIEFSLPKISHVTLTVYDLNGREIRKLLNEQKEAGYYSVMWNARDNNGEAVSSGVYFYQIEIQAKDSESKAFLDVKKMILMK